VRAGFLECELQGLCGRAPPAVARAQHRSLRQGHRGEEVRVDIADVFTSEPVPLDELEHLVGLGDSGHRQVPQQAQHGLAVGQTAAGNLADDKAVNQH
jgi:hypothetical protein